MHDFINLVQGGGWLLGSLFLAAGLDRLRMLSTHFRAAAVVVISHATIIALWTAIFFYYSGRGVVIPSNYIAIQSVLGAALQVSIGIFVLLGATEAVRKLRPLAPSAIIDDPLRDRPSVRL